MSEKVFNQPGKKYSMEDYMTAERRNTTRNEYFNGKILAKAGANRWHNLIASNIAIAIGSRVHGSKSEIYVNGMRVQLKNNCVCYPDVVLVSGEPVFADANADILQNPTAVVEIFSSNTSPTDKGQKLESYLAMDSIRECLLLKADEMRVEHYARQNAKQWIYRIYNERDDVISLDSVNCKLSLAEVYAQINLKQAELSSKAVN